jgi:uncharacterized membrane protein YhaH (DUF805 family)
MNESASWSLERLWTGRINRSHYLWLLLGLPGWVIAAIVVLVSVQQVATGPLTTDLQFVYSVPFAVVIGVFLSGMETCFAVRRLHDVGLSGLFALLLLIPAVGIVFALYLILRNGASETNKYGAPVSARRSLLAEVINL